MTAGLDLGVVRKIDGDGRPHVEVRQRAGLHVFGPCPIIEGPWTAGLVSEATAGGAGDAQFASHTHGAGVDLAVGDRVLVGYLRGEANAVVVLGRVR